jgi:hypothetical protein
MNKTLFFTLAALIGFSGAAPAQTSVPINDKPAQVISYVGGPADPAQRFARYAGQHPHLLLSEPVLRSLLMLMTGKFFPQLEQNLSTAPPVSVSAAGLVEALGCAPHECTYEEAQIVIDPGATMEGQVHVLILTEKGKTLLHFSNTPPVGAMLPDAVRHFVARHPQAQFVRMQP